MRFPGGNIKYRACRAKKETCSEEGASDSRKSLINVLYNLALASNLLSYTFLYVNISFLSSVLASPLVSFSLVCFIIACVLCSNICVYRVCRVNVCERWSDYFYNVINFASWCPCLLEVVFTNLSSISTYIRMVNLCQKLDFWILKWIVVEVKIYNIFSSLVRSALRTIKSYVPME